MQRVYKSIKKFKIMLDHRLRKQAWNVGCKVLKSNQSKILIDIMKCFKRWGVKYIFELSSNAIKYVIILETSVRPKEVLPCKEYTSLSKNSKLCLIIDCGNKLGTLDARY
mgnify:CR=1 FL=1